jgi:hypothetical protein
MIDMQVLAIMLLDPVAYNGPLLPHRARAAMAIIVQMRVVSPVSPSCPPRAAVPKHFEDPPWLTSVVPFERSNAL